MEDTVPSGKKKAGDHGEKIIFIQKSDVGED